MFTPVSFENRPVFIPDLVFRPQLSGENNHRKTHLTFQKTLFKVVLTLV